jgi:hypothetical protein
MGAAVGDEYGEPCTPEQQQRSEGFLAGVVG